MTWTTRPRSDFGSLKAICAGSGAPVLLLHGVGLRAEAWACQIDDLAEHFKVIAPDMPGHGESSLLNIKADLSAYTDCVASAVSEPVLVVGHSMGALMALDLAIRYPDRVRGVVALNAIFRRTRTASQAVKARADSLSVDRVNDPGPTLSRWFHDLSCAEAKACRAWLTQIDPVAYRQAYSVFAAEDGASETGLASLTCPALFMTGADEPNSTPAMSKAMAALTPNGRAWVEPGAAHMMPMTHPVAVNRALLDFFQKECSS